MADDEDLTAPEGRLRWARRRAGYETAADAARRLGWLEVTVRSHETGGRGYARRAALYAKAYRVDLEWLLTGKGSPDGHIDDDTAEVVRIMPRLDAKSRRELLEIAKMKERLSRDESG